MRDDIGGQESDVRGTEETIGAGSDGERVESGSRFVRLTGRRVMLEVRPSLLLTATPEKIIHGMDHVAKCLQGRVEMCAPDVTIGVKPGDEVLFKRPEGAIPDHALLSEDMIEAIVSYSEYGGDR
jgi:hypothetical protein